MKLIDGPTSLRWHERTLTLWLMSMPPFAACVFVASYFIHGRALMVFAVYGLLALGFVAALISTLIRKHLRERLREAGNGLCLFCRYRLDATQPTGRCLECGQPYGLNSVRERWAILMKFAD